MKKAFICSAYRGDIEKNAERARRYCLTAIDHGYAPFAPHLLYPQFLRDENLEDRYTGIQCGLEFLKCCDIMLVFGAITAGMHTEIEEAERLGMEIEYIGGIKDERGRRVMRKIKPTEPMIRRLKKKLGIKPILGDREWTSEDVAISKTETTSCEWCEIASACEYEVTFFKAVGFELGYDRCAITRSLMPNYCPNCGRKLKENENET